MTKVLAVLIPAAELIPDGPASAETIPHLLAGAATAEHAAH